MEVDEDDNPSASFSSMTVRDEDLDVSGIFNESEISQNLSSDDESVATICPSQEETNNQNQGTAMGPPPAPRKFKCPVCFKFLKTETGLNNHLSRHRCKEAAEKAASVADVLCHLTQETQNILNKIATERDFEVADLVKEVLRSIETQEWKNFYSEVLQVISIPIDKKEKILMPVTVRGDLMAFFSSFMSVKENYLSVLKKFRDIGLQCSDQAFWLFFYDLVKHLISETVIFLCKCMLPKKGKRAVNRDDRAHLLTIQVLYYIAGAALRHHVRRARQFPKNKRIQQIKECILSNFATIGSPPVMDRKNKAFWTHLMNRKSLIFVNDKAFEFFSLLGNLLLLNEGPDGSLMHIKIMDQVVHEDSRMLFVWNGIVNDALSEDVSFHFMCTLVRIVTNTYGRGLMIKRMNALCKNTKSNKSTLQVSHRARVI